MRALDLLTLKHQIGAKSNLDLIRRLGVAEVTFYDWLSTGKDLPVYIALAAAALQAGIPPYIPPPDLPEDLLLDKSFHRYAGGMSGERIIEPPLPDCLPDPEIIAV